MLRNGALLALATLVIGAGLHCGGDEETETGEGAGGTTATGTATLAGGGPGGASAGGSGGQGGEGAGAPACDPGTMGGTSCAEKGLSCETATGCCQCRIVDSCGTEPVWVCADESAVAACEGRSFSEGSRCSPDGLQCQTCSDEGAPSFWLCSDGWQPEEFGCTG